MTRVMAQGVFDVIHPGHVHYLRNSRDLGDELVVVLARDERVQEQKKLLMDHEDRLQLVESLNMVDEAIIGTNGDIYSTIDTVRPDIITFGYDQGYELDEVRQELENHGHSDIQLLRISEYNEADWEVVSSSQIKAELLGRERETAWFDPPSDGNFPF